MHASVGYSLIETERSIDQLITLGTVLRPFPILYESDADFLDARLRWQVAERWALGGDVRFYENSGTFPIERDDWRVYAEVDLTESYLLHVGYRTVDYDEGLANFDDYDADITEFAVGYRW
ncbi:MAG: hypothetical protein HC897_08920 [Thermoanaerobaculia bacterium]|nr:hypothetical protein [Thermoanaerobaculia bacterium]